MDQRKLKNTPGARKAKLPQFIQPQLATTCSSPTSDRALKLCSILHSPIFILRRSGWAPDAGNTAMVGLKPAGPSIGGAWMFDWFSARQLNSQAKIIAFKERSRV